MFTALCLAQVASPQFTPASTWVTAGVVHEQFAAADVNGDGFADIAVASPGGGLLVAESVRGWKAAPWRSLDVSAFPGGKEAFERAALTQLSVATPPAPPPYEPGAKLVRCFDGDLDGDGDLDVIAIYRCTRPNEFLELRVSFTPGPSPDDRDGDGLADADEAKLGTDPLDRDSDADGLLDGWEVHGLPRGIALGDKVALNPLQQDVVVAIAPYEGLDRAQVERELVHAAQLYKALPTRNRDGSNGINVHCRIDASVSLADQCGGDWAQCAGKRFATKERGFLHWMQVTSSGGGQSQQTGDMGGCGQGFAVFAHEFGHQLSLSHEGDSPAAWCPLYPSLMNYAFGYSIGGDPNAVHFSNGEFRATLLDEHALSEHLPYAFERVKYLAAPPFRFTLEDDHAGGTRIDWNHNGRFDDVPVSADINYGGSTYCGIRRDIDGSTIGAAPALTYVGDKCWLATLDTTQAAILVRAYAGNEKWGAARALPNSATNEDPLLASAWNQGLVFFRRPTGWLVSRFDDQQLLEPAEVAGLPNLELSVARVGENVLLVTRASDDTLVALWLLDSERLEVSGARTLALKSRLPVGIGVDPKDGRVVMASAMPNSRGMPLCLRVTWFEVQETNLIERETLWVRGEKSGTACTTRPVIAFDGDGQLNIFHTGTPQPDGQMTAFRTRRVGNEKLDEGWLMCLLYDVWTRTRRGVAFASGARGAIYAFRWDAAVANGMRVNELLVAHNGFGIDPEPMRDFDDGEKMSKHGLVHSILWMQQIEK